MSKEIIYASLAGSVLGLIIAFGVWRTNNAFKASTQPTPTPSGTSAPHPTGAFDLSIAKPNEEDLATSATTTVAGLSKPGSWITISGENKDYVLKANNDGSFTQDIDLVSGVNQIVVTTFDSDGSTIVKNLNIVYSAEFANQK